MSIRLVYDDVPPGIKANVLNTSAEYNYNSLGDTSVARAKQYKPDAFYKVATLEKDYWLLDGTFDTDSGQTNKPCIIWSNYIGNAEISNVRVKPTYTRTWAGLYTAAGITIVFGGDAYPDSIQVQWYKDDTELENETYSPDSFTYFCEKAVTEFNKVVITVQSMPDYRFTKIVDVIDGRQVEFTKAHLKTARILEEMSLTSESVPINQLTATILRKSEDLNYTFQNSQNIDAYYNDELYGKYFITKNERSGKYTFSITANDYKGVLDTSTFAGGFYDNASFSSIIADVIGDTVPYQIETSLASETFSGAIPPGTKREALTTALLGACAWCDTSRRNYLYLFKPNVNAVTKDADDTFYGKGSYTTDNAITSIALTRHSYKLSADLETVFDGVWTMTGTSFFKKVTFSNPVDPTTLVGTPASGTILWVAKSAYSCVFRLAGTSIGTGVVIQAKQYIDNTDTVTINNPNTVSSMQTNIHETSDYTGMVTAANSSAVLTFLSNYYKGSDTLESKIHIQGEKVGDTITLNTDWRGSKTGLIEKLDYSIINKTIGKAKVHINA